MILLLSLLLLIRWRLSLDSRREAALSREDLAVLDPNGHPVKLPGGGVKRAPDPVKAAFLIEEAMHARWSRRAVRALGVVAFVWGLVLASYFGAEAALDGAREMLARCDSKPSEVQACAAPAVVDYLEHAGKVGEYEALAWVIGIL